MGQSSMPWSTRRNSLEEPLRAVCWQTALGPAGAHSESQASVWDRGHHRHTSQLVHEAPEALGPVTRSSPTRSN